MSEFDSQLRNWYEAEVAGKAFFDALAGGAPNDREADKWSLLGRLESAMAARLSTACGAASIAIPEAPSDSSYLEYARKMAGEPFRSNLETLMPQLDEAVVRIRALAETAPPAHSAIAADFVAHEEALAAFVRAELEGEDGSSAIDSLLGAWA